MPLRYSKTGDYRYYIRVMGRYLDERLLGDHEERDKKNRILLNHVNIAAHYPSLDPAEPIVRKGNSFVALSILKLPPGSVRRKLDGSWINHLSIFDKSGPDTYGLSRKQRSDGPWDGDFILFRLGPEFDVVIECSSNPWRPAGRCTMLGQWPGEPGIRTSFERTDLAG